MKEVKLNMTEQEKYETIKELVDHDGNKKRVAIKLGLSIRQIDRLIKKYKKGGKASFVHGNRDKKPKNKIEAIISNKILTLYQTKYKMENEDIAFNFTHFKEMLEVNEDIVVSRTTISNILFKAGIISPKAHRITKRKLKRMELEKNKQLVGKTENEIEKIVDHQISLDMAHPRKDRKKNFGELIEMDASSLIWFGKEKTNLHLAIDNATGKVVGGFFDKEETLFGYYNIYKQILVNYGIPLEFLTDRRTVFEYESKCKKDENKDVLTHFGYSCHILGTELRCTSVPQAKGMIERLNGSFQGRLKNELWLKKIDTIKEANDYLINIFIPEYNNKFGLKNTRAQSVFEPLREDINIDNILAVISKRTFDSGHSIKYCNKYYIPTIDNQKVFFSKNTKCLIIRTFDGRTIASIDDRLFNIIEVAKPSEVSANFDVETKDETLSYKPKYAPLASHPWKKRSYDLYLKTTQHGVVKQQDGPLC